MRPPLLESTPSTGSGLRQTLRSEDGIIEFRLASTGRGVFVERLRRKPGKGRIVQATVFDNDLVFQRWCDADAMRHAYPLVYVTLRRSGTDLIAQRA